MLKKKMNNEKTILNVYANVNFIFLGQFYCNLPIKKD